MEINKIYNEDCFEGMKRIPNNSVNLIVTDLHIGIKKVRASLIPNENNAILKVYLVIVLYLMQRVI